MLRLIFILFLPLSIYASNDSLFIELDKALKEKKYYETKRLSRISGLKELLSDESISNLQRFNLNSRITQEYKPYSFDSTLIYVEKNLELASNSNDPRLIIFSHLDYAEVLASSGRYVEALDVLNQTNSVRFDKGQKVKYFTIYERIYSDLSVYAPSDDVSTKYHKLTNRYVDSLIMHLDKHTDDYLAIEEKKHRDAGNLELCRKVNSQRLAMATPGTQNYATINFERSIIYELQGDKYLEQKHLILSAIADVKASVKDNASLTRLALLLYREGEIERAYNYIKHSFEDANFYNSRLRFISISNTLPLITEAYQAKTENQKRKLTQFSFFISILSIILLVVIGVVFKQMKRIAKTQKELKCVNDEMKQANEKLQSVNEKLQQLNTSFIEANQLKEHYIGSLLTICSDYIDKLEAYRKMVNKSLMAKKIEELYKKTKNGDLLDREMQEYYENFDNTFLHLFPSFVEDFNSLLEDEAHITPPSEGSLNPPLRIFALIRLGITDSSTIARLLHYSVNTIYNYRVKYRNYSKVPRDSFKDYVQKIGLISN